MMTMALVLLRSLNLFPLQLTNTNISEPDIISMILKDNVSRLPPVIKTWNMAPFFTLVPQLTHRKQTIHHMSAEFILHYTLSVQPMLTKIYVDYYLSCISLFYLVHHYISRGQ